MRSNFSNYLIKSCPQICVVHIFCQDNQDSSKLTNTTLFRFLRGMGTRERAPGVKTPKEALELPGNTLHLPSSIGTDVVTFRRFWTRCARLHPNTSHTCRHCLWFESIGTRRRHPLMSFLGLHLCPIGEKWKLKLISLGEYILSEMTNY